MHIVNDIIFSLFVCFSFQVTELFDKLVKDEPDRINCQEEKRVLNTVLKINTSDPSSEPLRIPKQNKRPEDITLASGYKSKYSSPRDPLPLQMWVVIRE